MIPGYDLIQKYNVAGPRYTSYPTAVQFQPVSGTTGLAAELNRYHQKPANLSLYFHIPFCYSLCWYCGCTKIITKDADRGDVYLEYLQKEMDLIAPILHPDSIVRQIHIGGGTPTFLRPGQLLRFGEIVRRRFSTDQNVEFGVEIDPRNCTEEQIDALREIGCNRASLGIQDTNPAVQEAIHRIQPVEVNERVYGWLRKYGFEGVNVDLIYGLPKQTVETFRQTLDDMILLKPDRMAVYSYAHIPKLIPAQKLLNEDELPDSSEKLRMLVCSVKTLPEQGYRYIGMDHFAKEDDELVLALDNGSLQRNFQGYSTCGGTDMVAFGMSGISQTGSVYYQNTKDLQEYYRLLDRRRLPVVKQLILSKDDKIRRDVIMQIMCRTDLDYRVFSRKWAIDFDTYFKRELQRLNELERDGLVSLSGLRLKPTDKGRLFLRNIAMVFDAYAQQARRTNRYSSTV